VRQRRIEELGETMIGFLIKRVVDPFSRAAAQIVPIGTLFVFHGIFSHHLRWAVIGLSIALIEYSVFQLIWARLTWSQLQAVFEVFVRYHTCTFRRIPRTSYFKSKESYSQIDVFQNDPRIVLEPYYVAVYHFEGPGELIESPTFFETGVSPVIFLTDLPIGDAAMNRFIILHEIGHQSDLAGPPILFYQLLALLHIVLLMAVLFLLGGWGWQVAFFAFALASLYWYEGLRLVSAHCYDDLKREIIADEHAIHRLSVADCATVKDSFHGRFEAAAAALAGGRVSDLRRPKLMGRFEESDGVVRRYAGLDQLLRRMKGETFEGFSLAQTPNQMPVYLAVTFLLLLYASSFMWRWDQSSILSEYVIVTVALLSCVGTLYVRLIRQQGSLNRLLNERAPIITADELATARTLYEARRKAEQELSV
jgi:hypothetical protein